MLLSPTSDQEFFGDTTARFLAANATADTIRRLRDDPAGFDASYWRKGAELGWTSLLIGEAHGGGSISGAAIVDLTLIAHEFGRTAAPGPLVSTNVVASALSASGTHQEVIDGLLSGETICSWCLHGPDPATVEVAIEGDTFVLSGLLRPVESAGLASHVLVTGRTGAGLTQLLVPLDLDGITVSPLQTVDLTRRYSAVRFESVRVPHSCLVGDVDGGAEPAERQLQLGLVLLNAESVGAMERAFDMTVEWAFDRYSFGRPLASYQELKHRFADMKTFLEASHAISDEAAEAVQAGAPEAAELSSIAKSYIGDYGSELLQDCVQIHGGIGVTFEHDLHLFLRRTTTNRALLGTPADHRQRIAGIVEQGEPAA